MKRIALSLVALALFGALAVAEDAAPVAKISGYVESGLYVSNNSNGTYLLNYAGDYGPGGSPLITGPVATVKIDLAGSNFGYHIAPIVKGTQGAGLDSAYAWVSPLEGLTVLGSINGTNGVFNDLDDNGANAESTSGLSAYYTTSGVSLGVQESANTGVQGTQQAAPTWFMAHYELPSVVKVNAYATNGAYNQLDQIRITAAVLALSGVTLTGGYNASAMATTTNNFIDVTAGYNVTDAFYAGVVVYDRNISNSIKSGALGQATMQGNYLNYKPNVSYVFDPTVKALAWFVGDTTSNPNSEIGGQLVFTPVTGATLKAGLWYDTDTASPGYNNTYGVGTAAAPSTSGTTTFDVNADFAF